MKISVIIPCFNAGKYLASCLDSVLAQTWKEFEILIVDDGSQDDTLAIAQTYAQQDKRIRVFHQDNAGVCAARNRGLDEARGEFVTFVDGDDLLPAHALETMMSAAADGIDMVVCAHETFDEDGKREVFWPETHWMNKKGDNRRKKVALRLIEGDSVLNIMCNKLHRRSLIEREHLRLDESVAIAEDALFNLEAVLCGRDIAYVHAVCYRYRMHALSAMHRNTGNAFDTHLPWFHAMARMLNRRGVMKTYYPAFFHTVVLRLYKDGGVWGVVRDFAPKAWPVMDAALPRGTKLGARGYMLSALGRSGIYPWVYPLIYPAQVVKRKIGEAAFRMRAGKEKAQ